MCGRYANTHGPHDLAALFDADDDTAADERLPASYNVAPTDPVYLIRPARPPADGDAAPAPESRRRVSVARWGLVPHWAKNAKAGGRMFNARVEGVADSPAFRLAFAKRRCLVPADGWYEWARFAYRPSKQAYFLTPGGDGVVAFAGLWSAWKDPAVEDAPWLVTCSVLTTDAVGPLRAVHDRMPLALPEAAWGGWLGEAEPSGPLGVLLDRPAAAGDAVAALVADVVAGLELRPVGPDVGNVRNNSPELTRRLTDVEPVDLTLF